MTSTSAYVIGLDFGTDSVRSLIVDARTGESMASAVQPYTRWSNGWYCDARLSQFRQHPLDYAEAMEKCLQESLAAVSQEVRARVTGISIDATGSTPVAVNRQGLPLALLPEFAENPNAMFILWKDHTAHEEADRINELAHSWSIDYTSYSGGIYSPEWFWAKIWHTLRVDTAVAEAAFSWVEQCDWLPGLLAGNTNPLQLKRSRCAAGHKAMWHADFGGLPSLEFLNTLDPCLGVLRERLYRETYTADVPVGLIDAIWAEKLGLSRQVLIGTGALDAHMGAVGACISPYMLVKVTGTSTCDMLMAPLKKHGRQLVRGICGQVDGSIIPDMLGMEAGQSAFGDVYQWFARLLAYPIHTLFPDKFSADELAKLNNRILQTLSLEASLLPLSADDEIALDWINGRRTPDADLTQKAMITGLSLGSSAARLFKALVEATAFGSRAIVDRFEEEGIPVNGVIALGGISKRSAFVMQTLANVLQRPIRIVRSEQACALGAAMFAAVVSGIYPHIADAQAAMASGFEQEYQPDPEKSAVYQVLYEKYLKLGE